MTPVQTSDRLDVAEEMLQDLLNGDIRLPHELRERVRKFLEGDYAYAAEVLSWNRRLMIALGWGYVARRVKRCPYCGTPATRR